MEKRLRAAEPAERPALQAELTDARAVVRAEKITEVAAAYDGVHDVQPRRVEVRCSVTGSRRHSGCAPESCGLIETLDK